MVKVLSFDTTAIPITAILLVILPVHLSRGNIKPALQPSDDALDYPPLVLQRHYPLKMYTNFRASRKHLNSLQQFCILHFNF